MSTTETSTPETQNRANASRASLPSVRRRNLMSDLGRSYVYVLSGLPIAIFSFALLVAMTALSTATVILWIGALLMPMTLLVASGFAAISRRRAAAWGAEIVPVHYRRVGRGLTGPLRLLADARRWLDLVFEMLIALPVRLVTFTVALIWTVIAVAGPLSAGWLVFVPPGGGPAELLRLSRPELAPTGELAQYLVDAGTYTVLGVIFLLSLPLVMRLLAGTDAAMTAALLGGDSTGSRPREDSRNEFSTRAPDTNSGGFSGRAWAWIGVVFSAVVLLAVHWPITATVYSISAATAMLLTVAHCAALPLTLRWVWPGLGLSLLASAGLIAAAASAVPGAGAASAVWPWSVTAMITQSAVLVLAALTSPWYTAASAWCAGALITVAALMLTGPELPAGAVTTSIVFGSVSASVVVIGVLVRLWILSAGRLEVAERSGAEQDRRQKELTERNRIARELHDVVAHSMSVISVQASTAAYRHPGMGEEAQQEFNEIANSSRRALREMRLLLSILRGDDEAPTAPEPGLDGIDTLIEATRASGTQITFAGAGLAGSSSTGPRADNDDGVPQLPRAAGQAVGQAAYRIVQEALSNALRHAPGAEIHVTLEPVAEALRLLVLNGPAQDPLAPPAPGAGLGLSGIRERAAAVGGTAEVGPTTDGGFRVQAHLPL